MILKDVWRDIRYELVEGRLTPVLGIACRRVPLLVGFEYFVNGSIEPEEEPGSRPIRRVRRPQS